MLCDRCKKRPATVYITHISANQSSEEHLCEVCAKESGHFQLSPQISFQKFFPQFFSIEDPIASTNTTCEECGMTLSQLAKTGKPGCPDCYETFSDSVRPLLKRIHASSQHIGKIPGKSGEIIRKNIELSQLRNELNLAIKDERFEEAARLRDNIRLLEIEQQSILEGKQRGCNVDGEEGIIGGKNE